MILKIDDGVHKIDLSPYQKLVEWHPGSASYLNMMPGENHTRLLAYLSLQLPDGSIVADLGTYEGHSAIALSHNQKVKVKAFDLIDCIPPGVPSYHDRKNISFTADRCENYLSTLMDSSIILLDISPHNGSDERQIVNELIRMEYPGLLICDDIKLSEAMINFWNWVPIQDKYDVTPYGHWSGTGIVVFNKKFIDIKIG